MVESKRQLLKELTESHANLESLPGRIRRENIYLEDGIHVDCEFMMAILKFMNYHVSVTCEIMRALEDLLGIERGDSETDKKKKEGGLWSAEEVLKHCTFKDNILKLPDVQLNPKSYADTKTWITEAGGKWEGGKTQGFTFDFDATRVVSILMTGKRCNLRQDFQFFETPSDLADWLVSLAGVTPDDVVLEPSAGRGAIIKAIHRAADVNVDYFELMPENQQFLSRMENVTFCGEDFTQGVPKLYTRIFANPPFAKNQDVHHVHAMYEALDNDGILCAITSRHWLIASEKTCTDFRGWLEEVKAEVHEIPEGVFKESGTNVATIAIKIKRSNLN